MNTCLSLGGIRTYLLKQEDYFAHLLIQTALTIVGFAVMFENITRDAEAIRYVLPIGYVLLFMIAGLRILRLQPQREETDQYKSAFSFMMSAHLTVNFALFVANFGWAVINSIR